MKNDGLTIIEVIIAVAIIAIVMGTLTTTVVSNLKRTSTTNGSTQAAQVLNYLGRRVSGAQSAVLPVSNASFSWDYGELETAFPDLASEKGVSDPKFYRAQITNTKSVSFAGATLVHYDLSVCHRLGGGEHCLTGITFAPSPADASDPEFFLPGIN